jgi:hypothetical protein
MFGIFVLLVSWAPPSGAATRGFQSLQGRIDMDRLGFALSERLETEVRVIGIRGSDDPYEINSAEVSRYLIDLEVEQSHRATCELVLFNLVRQAALFECESADMDLRFRGFTDYSEMGL